MNLDTNQQEHTSAVTGGTLTVDQSRTHNKDNQLIQIDASSSGISYDKAGNATAQPPQVGGDWNDSYTLIWDAWNRLVKVKDESENLIVAFEYDGLTRRIKKIAGDVTRHYYYSDRWKPLEERVDSGTTADRRYVWGARANHRDELVLRDRDTDGNGTLDERLYATMDFFNGTAIVDTSGNVKERYGYTAFGVRRVMAADFSNRTNSDFDWDFGFQGQFIDTETGYINYGFRYYTPDTGRWLSRDSIGENGGVNLYAIVMNGPVNGVDFLGLREPTEQEDWDQSGGSQRRPWGGHGGEEQRRQLEERDYADLFSWIRYPCDNDDNTITGQVSCEACCDGFLAGHIAFLLYLSARELRSCGLLGHPGWVAACVVASQAYKTAAAFVIADRYDQCIEDCKCP